VRALSLAIPHAAGGLGFALDVLLSALLVLPPAILMGGTIPILTQALSRSLADATRLHANVYAFNTAGAFLGALAAAFVLIPWLGLERVVLAMGLVNLTAGATFGAIGVRRRALFVAPASEDAAAKPAGVGVLAAVALLAGFAAMVFQTVLIRLGGLSLGSSNFTFSMIVAVFVLCIALGSFVVSALPRIPGALLVAAQWILAGAMALLYARLNYAPYWAHIVRSWFRDEDAGFYPFHALVFLLVLAVLIVPIGLSGATLPLIFHHLKRKVGDLGAAAGRHYAWNTVGSLLGALLGGYVLFFWLDLDQVYVVGVGAVIVAASLLTVEVFALPRVAAVLLLAPALSALTFLPRWDNRPFAAATFRMRQPNPADDLGPERFFDRAMGKSRVTFYDDDPNSSVAVRVTDLPQGADPAIVTNGKPDGSIFGDSPTRALAGLLPALFVDRPEHAFVIGYGTGVSAGEIAALDTLLEVTVAEISPGVIKAAPHFEKLNQHALTNGKTTVVVADAYRALLRSDRTYDIISSEPSNPWVAGVEMLFSQEFLRAAKDRLRPGGVYAQWFHSYENDANVVELVLRTYASVFDQVAVWYTLGPDLILLGFKDPDVARAIDVARLERRFHAPDVNAGLHRAGVTSFPALLAHELLPIGLVNAAHFPGDVHTILHPVLSYRAGRAFFRGLQSELPDTLTPELMKLGEERTLLGRWVQASGGKLGDVAYQQMVDEACKTRPRLCATLLAYWQTVSPNAPGIGEKQAALLGLTPFRAHVSPGRLGTLVSFFQDDASGPPLTPTEARQLSTVFADYYHHGLGFWRDVLPAIWGRCEDAKRGECARARKGVERRVGAIGPLQHAAGG
jgi:spermidine synthase